MGSLFAEGQEVVGREQGCGKAREAQGPRLPGALGFTQEFLNPGRDCIPKVPSITTQAQLTSSFPHCLVYQLEVIAVNICLLPCTHTVGHACRSSSVGG
jgi:hypothetical protein